MLFLQNIWTLCIFYNFLYGFILMLHNYCVSDKFFFLFQIQDHAWVVTISPVDSVISDCILCF